MQRVTPDDVTDYAQWFYSLFEPWSLAQFHTFLSPPLDFRNQLFDWDLDITSPRTRFGDLRGMSPSSVQLARLLIETGIAVTPAANPLGDFRAGYAAVRYSEYFRTRPTASPQILALSHDPALRSSRLRQLMAEELASGIACFLLREHLDVVHIVDYQIWRSVTNPREIGKYPDFYCVTSTGEGLLVEVKGSITRTRSSMTQPRSKARLQLRNGRFGNEPRRSNGDRFSIATNFLVLGPQLKRSISYIERVSATVPRAGRHPGRDSRSPILIDDAITLSFCKVLHYVGLHKAAEKLHNGERMHLEDYISLQSKEELYNSKFTPIGVDPFANVILVETDVLHDLNRGRKPKLPKQELKLKKSMSKVGKYKAVIPLNDSVIAYPNPGLLGKEF